MTLLNSSLCFSEEEEEAEEELGSSAEVEADGFPVQETAEPVHESLSLQASPGCEKSRGRVVHYNTGARESLNPAGQDLDVMNPAHPCSSASLQTAYSARRLAFLGISGDSCSLLGQPVIIPEGQLLRQVVLGLQGLNAKTVLMWDARGCFKPVNRPITTVCTSPALVSSLLQSVAAAASDRYHVELRLDGLLENGRSATEHAFARGVRSRLAEIDRQLSKLEESLQRPGLRRSHTDFKANRAAPTLTSISYAVETVACRTRRLRTLVDTIWRECERWPTDLNLRACAIINSLFEHSQTLHYCKRQIADQDSAKEFLASYSEGIQAVLLDTLVPLFRELDRMLSSTCCRNVVNGRMIDFFLKEHITRNATDPKVDARGKVKEARMPDVILPFVDRIVALARAIRLLRKICPTDEGLIALQPTLENQLRILMRTSGGDARPLARVHMCIKDHLDQPHFAALRQRLVTSVLQGQGLLRLTRTVRSLYLLEHEHYMHRFLMLLYDILDTTDALSTFADHMGQDLDKFLTAKLAGELSENLENNTVESIHVVCETPSGSAAGLELLGTLRLELDVPSPLDLIVDEHALRVCQAVFSFLLKTKAVNYHLNRFHHDFRRKLLAHGADARSSKVHALNMMLMEELSFCHNLQNHLMRRMRLHSWEDFVEHVKSAKEIDELHSLHKEFLEGVCKSCFLNPVDLSEKTPIYKVIMEILKACLKFKQIATKAFDVWPENPRGLYDSFTRITALHNIFINGKSFLEKVNSYAKKEDEFLL